MDKKRIEHAVHELLSAVGEDPTRPGLIETPERVARMYEEVFGSLEQGEHFSDYKVFPVAVDPGLVMVQQIPFYSMCEHHLLPFFGHVTIGYMPIHKQIIGLSKLGRLVEFVARRPSVQEAFTAKIDSELTRILAPQGVAVSVVARHMCMEMRGINRGDLFTYTSRYSGVFETDAQLRKEFQAEARRTNGNV